jgi:bacterioferritin-associated ferredoxin
MIICVCNNVSEHKVRQAVQAGIQSLSELRSQLDVGNCCGKCNGCAKRLLRECLSGANDNAAVAA